MKKRLFALFLTMCLMLTILPSDVLAADVIASGYCGGDETAEYDEESGSYKNLTWMLDEDGILTISGNGKMKDCDGKSPWSDRREQITAIVIENGATSIGNYIFYYHKSLMSVEIPSSVTRIGIDAFRESSCLNRVYITDIASWLGITFDTIYANPLHNGAILYLNGKAVTNLEIPSSATRIGNYIFCGCSSLTYVMIPSSVKEMGNYAFCNCSSLMSAEIYASVTTIGNYAFYDCSSLTSVVLPSSLTSIGNYSFYDCNSLTSVDIPSGVNSIGNYSFYQCKSLTNINIPLNVKSIGSYAFESCSSLKNVVIPPSVTSMRECSFSFCGQLDSIVFEGSLPAISNNAFQRVTALAYYPKYDASWIEDVRQNYGGSLSWIPYAKTVALGFCGAEDDGSNLKWTINEEGQLTISGNGTMVDYTNAERPWPVKNITMLVIEAGVTSIGSAAFADCTNLKIITFEGMAPTIARNSFQNVTSEVYYPQVETSWSEIVGQDYGGTLTWLPYYRTIAAGYCGGEGGGANLSWKIDEEGTLLISGSGNMKNYSYSKLAPWNDYYSLETGIKQIEIKNGVTSIGEYAFYSSKLKNVKVPSSVITIGRYAFGQCNSLASVVLGEGVANIGEKAFYWDTSLKDVIFEGSAPSFGADAFYYVHAQVYYPKYDTTWIEDIRQDYGGKLSWVAKETETLNDNNVTVSGYGVLEGSELKAERITSSTLITSVAVKANCSTKNIALWDIAIYKDGEEKQPFGRVTVSLHMPDEFTEGDTALYHVTPEGILEPIPYEEENRKAVFETDHLSYYALISKNSLAEGVITRLAGKNRTATAAEISKASFAQAEEVVLASSLDYADALAGAPLAYAMKAPILLVGKKLDTATTEELARLGAKSITILGGTVAVSTDVESQLNSLGYKTERLAGDNRYGTAVKIAQRLETLNGKTLKEAFFASAENYPDALAISPVAAMKGAPILYVAANGKLRDTAAYLKDSSITSGTILGGKVAVAETAEKNIKDCGVTSLDRLGGDNRYLTCLLINEKYADCFAGTELCVATGLNYPDALAGGVYAAVKKAPLFLVNNKKLSDEQKAFVKVYSPAFITAFGGETVVSDEMLDLIVETAK